MASQLANNAVQNAIRAVLVWTAVEFAIRRVVAKWYLGSASPVKPFDYAVYYRVWIGTALIAMVVLASLFAAGARREHLSLAALGYKSGGRFFLAGLVSGAVILALMGGVALIERALWTRIGLTKWTDIDLPLTALRRAVATGTPLVDAGFLVTNGLVAPVVEEFVWRGYVQRAFDIAWGPSISVLVTAFLFVAKHSLVDLSASRVFTQSVAAVGLGVVRQLWGTGASTMAHMGFNTAVSLLLLSGL